MNAPVLPAAGIGRITGWFRGSAAAVDPPPADATAIVDTRLRVDRQLYDTIGAFLFAHRLAPIPAHFEIAHAYLTGSDPAIARAIGSALAETGTLDADAVATLAAGMRHGETGAQALGTLADQLERQLASCLGAATRTQSSARDYGDALDQARTHLALDPAGTLEHIAGLTREVLSTTRLVEGELKQARRETQRLRSDLDHARDAAERDHLTGLPNRRGFERRVAEAIATDAPDGQGRPGAVVALCDIDDFKRVNDIHGHPVGDRVLTFVGTFLSAELGAGACVARHGGEEFAVLLTGRTPQQAASLIGEVRDRLADRSLVNQDTGLPLGRITFSAGVAALVDDATDALAAADAALYDAKRGGKNAVAVAGPLQAKCGGGGRPSR